MMGPGQSALVELAVKILRESGDPTRGMELVFEQWFRAAERVYYGRIAELEAELARLRGGNGSWPDTSGVVYGGRPGELSVDARIMDP